MYHLIINFTLKTSVGVGDGKLDCSDRLAPDTHLSDVNLWLHFEVESEISLLIFIPPFLHPSLPFPPPSSSFSPSFLPLSASPPPCFPSFWPVAQAVRQERSLFPKHWLLLVANKKLNLLISIKSLLSPESPNRGGRKGLWELGLSHQAYCLQSETQSHISSQTDD